MLFAFLDYLRFELNRAPLTVDAYKRDIEQFQKWLTSDKTQIIDYPSITSNDLRAWLAVRARLGDTPRTIRRKIISLRTFFKWMLKSGHIKKAPTGDITLPKISKPLPDIVKPGEVETALISEKNFSESNEEKKALRHLVIEMLYSLGIRRAELVALNDSDISDSKAEIKVTGKRSKQRIIPIPLKLLISIRNWQSIRNKNQESLDLDSPLFTIKGKRISPFQVYRIVKGVLSDANARKKSPHALRHSFASAMLNEGAEIDAVREFLGHASLATTQIYTHISFKDIKKAYNQAHPRADNKK